MPTYAPNPVAPFDGDETPDLKKILTEVRGGLSGHEKGLVKARELQDWFDGESEKYVAFKPSEDALSWLTRPKRVSFITRQAITKLTSHLYKPGPRARTVSGDPKLTGWYRRVAQDLHLNGVMQQADALAHLHGIVAIGLYPTRDPRRPVGYHLYKRFEFVHWVHADDPRVATAVCTVTYTDRDTVRYRLWTNTHYYTFYKGKDWGYQPGGWNVARFVPEESGTHPYGVLPFAFVTHELPTTRLDTPGIGHALAKVNRALNIDKSNLALWVHHYARPLGFVSGVGPEWRPKFLDGGFVPLNPKHDSTEEAPVIPEARYLESNLDIDAICNYIRGEANAALSELDVPLTLSLQSDGGGGSMAQSGLAIAAQDADPITYAKRRQPLFDMHESHLAAVIAAVGASDASVVDPGTKARLAAFATDPTLRVAWTEPTIDLPGPARDQADQWELDHGLTDPLEILMRRQGLTEPEAIDAYRASARRRRLVAAIEAAPDQDPPADLMPGEGEDPDTGAPEPGDTDASVPDTPGEPQLNTVNPSITVTTAVPSNFPIPAAPLILPATPGYGSWGTEA